MTTIASYVHQCRPPHPGRRLAAATLFAAAVAVGAAPLYPAIAGAEPPVTPVTPAPGPGSPVMTLAPGPTPRAGTRGRGGVRRWVVRRVRQKWQLYERVVLHHVRRRLERLRVYGSSGAACVIAARPPRRRGPHPNQSNPLTLAASIAARISSSSERVQPVDRLGACRRPSSENPLLVVVIRA
jgi:hypothetical protein